MQKIPYALMMVLISMGAPVLAESSDFAAPKAQFNSLGEGGPAFGLIVRTDDTPLIAFNGPGQAGNVLKVVNCEDSPCAQTTVEELDTERSRMATDVLIRDNGLPLIAQSILETGLDWELSVLNCLDAVCSSASKAEIELGPQSTVEFIDRGTNSPWILSHRGGLNSTTCSDADCTSLSKSEFISYDNFFPSEISDFAVSVASDGTTAMAVTGAPFDPIGRVIDDLAILTCQSDDCTVNSDRVVIDKDQFSSQLFGGVEVQTRADGRPIFYVYDTDDGIVAYDCSDVACTNGTLHPSFQPIDGFFGTLDMVVRGSGRPLFISTQFQADTLLIDCFDQLCSSSRIQTIAGNLDRADIALLGDETLLVVARQIDGQDADIVVTNCELSECLLDPVFNSNFELPPSD